MTNSWRCLAMWYSAFSLRSPIATAFFISLGSSTFNSCSSTEISSCSFFLICSGMCCELTEPKHLSMRKLRRGPGTGHEGGYAQPL